MKKILTILLLVTLSIGLAQTKPSVKTAKTSTSTTPKKNTASPGKNYSNAIVNLPLDTLKHFTCLEKQFSIVFYIVLDSLSPSNPNYPGIQPATASTLALLVNELNNTFAPICVSFKNCTTVFIPNFSYGKSWLKDTTESHVTSTYYTDKTINFYLCDTVHGGHGNTEYEGYTYDPSPANLAAAKKDLLVLDKVKILQGNFAIVKHLLGHFFGLPHTFEEVATPPMPPATPGPPNGVTSHEYADGSNCWTHGDRFCDTDADPGKNIFVKDGKGNFYLPPKDNLMSYYSERCRFTQEQYNWMAHIIMTKRLYLH